MGLIYIAKNLISGKCYIGQTTSTLEYRRYLHEHSTLKGSKYYFHNALRLYGFESFEWSVLIDDLEDEELSHLEITLIRNRKTLYPNGYNMTEGGEGGRHCQETRDRIGRLQKGRKRTTQEIEKMRASLKGKKHSDVTKDKIRKALAGRQVSEETRRKIGLGRTGILHTPESKAKMGLAQKGKKRSEAFKKRVSEVHTGRKDSPETTQRRIEGQRNRVLSEESLEKMREAGRKSAGRKASEETKLRMSESHKKHHADNPEIWDAAAKKSSETQRGRKLTEEHKAALSEAAKTRPPMTEETKKKCGDAARLYHRRKRALNTLKSTVLSIQRKFRLTILDQ